MKLSAYVSPSRHGIYYFRWPLPVCDDQRRHSVRISLKTRCPDHAGDLARHLASCGRILKGNKGLARLTRTELRTKVKAHFAVQLIRYLDCLNRKEPAKKLILDAQEELLDHESLLNIESTHPQWLKIEHFKNGSGISERDWAESQPMATNELRKGRIDLLRAILSAVERPDGLSATLPCQSGEVGASVAPRPLSEIADDFIAEHSKWSDEMRDKTRSYLSVLIEFFGKERMFDSITRQDAAAMKKVLQSLPARRNTIKATRNLPLLEAIKVDGIAKLHPKTANLHIDTFRRLWDWAKRHGYASEVIFERMKFDLDRNADAPRDAFTKAETTKILVELTDNTSGLVKKEDHKWGALLGLFTGARVREIGQLSVSDIKLEDDIWYIDFNEDGDGKSIKTRAGHRRVPVHSELIRLGFLDFVRSRPSEQRLFLSFSANKKDGYGRNLGRWFNTTFLPALGLKTETLVFHSLRHTMIDRLTDAGVDEPIVQFIIGHSRTGTTQNTYNRKGYSLTLCKEVIERFEV